MKGADQCPKCGNRRRTLDAAQPVTPFYATVLRVCGNCRTAWEPFEESALLDEGVRYSSFKDPCDNCAFRPGSYEQQDKEKWKELIAQLEFDVDQGLMQSHRFYCHKGVPLDVEHKTASDSGFAYPYTEDGKPIVAKLRACRGYLRMIRAQMDKHFAANPEPEESTNG